MPGAQETDARKPLPRGPHGLSRAEVAGSQRARLIAAFTELLAERGYAGVTIGDLAAKAGVSRGAFYEQFESKEACLLAAYEQFAAGLVEAMTADVAGDASWDEFISSTLAGYLGTLERDPVAARAFLVEMDAAGEVARRRRREGAHGFANLLAQRHEAIRQRDPQLGELSDRVYVGLVLGVRELAREALEDDPAPRLTEMTADIVAWVTATVEGATSAAEHRRT